MLNIVIPMAGRGSRFEQAGYLLPKPLIDVAGTPMIKVVTDNLSLKGKYIFLVLKEHYDKYNLSEVLPSITEPNECEIVIVDRVTEGAACTILLAKHLINNDDELVIANSDQWVDWSSAHFIDYMRRREAHGGICTFYATHPKWSFAKVNEDGIITEVAEKNPISSTATVGIYYWSKGSLFVNSAELMISKNIRTNGEFYACPAYNELIQSGGIVYNYPVPRMMGLGVPEDLEKFLREEKNVTHKS